MNPPASTRRDALDPVGFGPWRENLAEPARAARLRELRALIFLFCGPDYPLVVALRDAEADHAAAEPALAQLDALRPLRRRRVLATYAELQRP
jgi:hypothetical protein